MVRTTADEKLDEAIDHVKRAAMALADITIHECFGSDDLPKTLLAEIRSAQNDLINIRAQLVWP